MQIKITPRINAKGFTLLELLMTIVLMGLISLTAALLLYHGTQSFAANIAKNELRADGLLALERMTREIHLIRCTTAGNSCAPSSSDITDLTASELRFVNTNLQGRGFRANAGNLLLRQGVAAADPEDVLSENVSSMTFDYMKQNGSAVVIGTDPVSSVWIVNVTINLSTSGQTLAVKTSVHPRSFR